MLEMRRIFAFCSVLICSTYSIYTPGVKNAPIQMHHNYSHVKYQNAQSHTEGVEHRVTTEDYHPVYHAPNEIQQPVTRVKKQLEIYEKCPPGATGQFVYSLSCNQFLNCWKGRTFVQNCSPGTLFNPDSLTCDFPQKVKCITGPRSTLFEQPPPENTRKVSRDVQQKCPVNFTGKIPNYFNCTKFIECNQGRQISKNCPENTLFDVTRNSCNSPKFTRCFNEEQGSKHRIAYKPVNSNEFRETFYGSKCVNRTDCRTTTEPTYVYESYENYGPSNCFPPNCDRNPNAPVASHTIKVQKCDSNYRNCENIDQTIPSQSLNQFGRPQSNADFGSSTVASPKPQQANNFNRPNCIPFYGKCEHRTEPTSSFNKFGPQNNTNFGQTAPTPSSNQFRPQNFDGFPVASSQQNCDPRYRNCGTFGRTTPTPSSQFYDSTVAYPKQTQTYFSNQNRQTHPEHSSGGVNIECPSQGVHPHPSDCSKFLNCANGQAFIQTCGPGTLFNSKMMTCDFDYNVECAHETYTELSDNSVEANTEYHRTSRPVHHDSHSGNPNVSPPPYLKPHDKTKTWPPPFYPSTDTNADYVFENTDVDINCQNDKLWSCQDTLRKCIAKNDVCNGRPDCSNGNDEENCDKNIKKFDVKRGVRLAVIEMQRWDNTTLPSCAFLCLDSQNCKSFNYRNIDNCCFLSDKNEAMTGKLIAFHPNDYYELKSAKIDCENMFKCSNNKCLDKSKVCDGHNDCGEMEDEKNCDAHRIGYEIRLTGSKNKWEGRIEITAFGRVGYICDDRFDIRAANVACQELGYASGAAEIKGNSHYAENMTQVRYMMDDIFCTGNETSIRECDFNGWGSHDCTDQEVVGVVCKNTESCPENFWKCKTTNECVPMAFVCDGPEDCSDGSDENADFCASPIELRLVNGTTPSEGRVEVKYHDVWGTICDDDFNDDAAKVICQSLGYRGAVTVKKDAFFGEGTGPIWLDQVACYGNESKLENCSHWNWGEHNCDHSEDVAVVCTDSGAGIATFKHVKTAQSVKTPSVNNNASIGNRINPPTCGLRKDNMFNSRDDDVHFRVVQGSKAVPGSYPWQAALRVKGKLHTSHWCGAVIISSHFLLTAAHCLLGYPKGAYVLIAGDYNVSEDEGTEQQAFIENFYVHEDFRRGHKMNNDIALIKLKGNGFRLNQDVQAICLPEIETKYEPELNCTISGFGSVETGTSAFSNELRAGYVPIQPDDVCKMPHVYGASLTDGMFCAGTLDGGVDSCDGDSGGPLACLNEGFYTLYGITSWGQRCGYANKPGVYVKVAHYRAWIDEKLRSM